MGNNGIERIEDTRDNILGQTREDLKSLMDDTQRHQKFYKKIVENLENGHNSIEGQTFNKNRVKRLAATALDISTAGIIQQRELLNKYTYRMNQINSIDEEEIGDSDGANQKFEEFKLKRLSLNQFDNFILSEEGQDIITRELEGYINNEISENELALILKSRWNTTIFREYYGVLFGEDENYIDTVCNIIENKFNPLISEFISNGGNKFDIELIDKLGGIVNEIELLFSDTGDDDTKDFKKIIFASFLEENINDFSNLVYKDGKISLETGEDRLDLLMKSCLYVYGKLCFPDLFDSNKVKNGYDTSLTEILKLVLSKYNPELEKQIKDKKLLEQKKKAEQERQKRELRMRQEAERRNREKNSNLSRKDDSDRLLGQNQNSDDAKDDSGANLVKNSNVNLSDFSVVGKDSEPISENLPIKDKAFNTAWSSFIEHNDKIKNIITYSDMIKLHDMQRNSIDKDAWESFLTTNIMKGRTDEEINQIYETLQSFSNNYNEAIKSISNRITKGREKMDDKIKMYALGAVIDNVKDVFDSIVSKWQGESKFEGFSFDSYEPVKRQGNDIIISGKFNGADIKIRYNLISGGLFMNSFIHHLSPSKVTIGNNTDADYKIGQLKSFDTILDEHYHSPELPNNKSYLGSNGNRKFNQNNGGIVLGERENNDNEQEIIGNEPMDSTKNIPSQTGLQTVETHHTRLSKDEIASLKKRFGDMLNANVDLIGDAVVNYTKKQSTRNSIIIKFMKTFNIVLDEGDMKNIDVNNESNMFDFIQIIENSDSTALESFQIFMEKIMEYSGLSRGNNNLQGSQRNQKSDLVLHENDNNKYASLLRSCSINFSNNIENLKGKLNFDSNSQIGFIKMISENITNDVTKPNWKLDISKMNEFIYHLENGTKTVV